MTYQKQETLYFLREKKDGRRYLAQHIGAQPSRSLLVRHKWSHQRVLPPTTSCIFSFPNTPNSTLLNFNSKLKPFKQRYRNMDGLLNLGKQVSLPSPFLPPSQLTTVFRTDLFSPPTYRLSNPTRNPKTANSTTKDMEVVKLEFRALLLSIPTRMGERRTLTSMLIMRFNTLPTRVDKIKAYSLTLVSSFFSLLSLSMLRSRTLPFPG